MVIVEKPDRIPLARERKVGLAVAVEVCEHRAADHAQSFKYLRDRITSPIVVEQIRISRFGITARHSPAAHEQIEFAVAIHVRHGQRTG